MAKPPPISLFPPVPKSTLTPSGKLTGAIKKAVDGVAQAGSPAPPFAITLIDLNNNTIGSYRETEEHYAASVVKVAVMYAAYALLDMVQRYNTFRKPATAKELLRGLKTEMNGAIELSSRVILGGTANSVYRVPGYESMFDFKELGKTVDVQFQRSYLQAMHDMIVPSHWNQTARCIHGIGYSYLNGLLESHGFFTPGATAADHKGVFVGGDFAIPPKWVFVRIPCVNDVDTAQGSTSEAIARLMYEIMYGESLKSLSRSHIDMIEYLRLSAIGDDPTLLSRPEVSNRYATGVVTHAKIGRGPLKGATKTDDKAVFSEVCKLTPPGRKSYIVGFVNIDYKPYSLKDIVTVINKATEEYEK
jgi:hypothetical protein